jgi:hypothetical protein
MIPESVITVFGSNTLTVLQLLLVLICVEIGIQIFRAKRRRQFNEARANLNQINQVESESIEYHRDIQRFTVARFFIIIIVILSILFVQNKESSVFVFTFATLVLIFKEPIISFFAYMYVLSGYKIGNTIKVDDALGKIVSVKPFYTAVAGHDEAGEHNGKLYQIPNYVFFQKTIEQRELKTRDHRRAIVNLIYNREIWVDSFSEWLKKLQEFLDGYLPERTLAEVGNFKSYAGVRYKLGFEYNDKGNIVTVLSFITSFEPMLDRKQAIFEFMETLPKAGKGE